MKIIKVVSNNAVVSQNELGEEVVVLGKGIGFQKKVGCNILLENVEKVYKLPKKHFSNFEKIIYNMPYEHINVANKIISYASKNLEQELNQHIYITLTDHINFAIERNKKNIKIENALISEIRNIYVSEYKVALKALDIIESNLNIRLNEDEAGFIAMHLVNAQTNLAISDTYKLPEIINNILKIVKDTYNVLYNENSSVYERFLTHLKFFTQRIVEDTHYLGKDDDFYKMYLEKYTNSAKGAYKIADFVKNETGYVVTNEELMYLTMHIERITNR